MRLVEPITSAWWINGEFDYQRLRQQLGLVVAFANGQVVPVISQGVMGMHRPRFIGIRDLAKPPVGMRNEQGYTELGLGKITGPPWGYQFWTQVESPWRGSHSHTQLCKLARGRDSGTDCTGTFWLDNGDEEGEILASKVHGGLPFGVLGELSFNDPPGSEVGATWVSCDDSFRVYVRFKPFDPGTLWEHQNPENIYVTVGRVDWRWSARADKIGEAWSVTSSEVPDPELQYGHELPEWDKEYPRDW